MRAAGERDEGEAGAEGEAGPEGPESPESVGREEERSGRHVVDRADYDPDHDPDAPVLCEICGAVMEYTASCKLVCRNCGYTRDCSDP